MATYDYEYTRLDGEVIRITQYGVPMSRSKDPIVVVDPVDGQTYTADRIMSLTANMGLAWSEDVRNSDLPPKHYGPEDVKRDLDRRRR